MRNFIMPGNALSLIAPYLVNSGDGLLVGSIFGVAACAAASGAEVQVSVTGVYELPKASAQAWALGAKVYWDNTNKLCTTASSGNTLIGAATAVAANPSSTGIVRLNGAVS
ncbi:putative RecA/RadA family phage recombinase [Azospirillum agricola]|uniref:DUF2190 family protein n=1 Tax=Azospirillum agricola TaxID=1720247 RepID=UPI001AE8B0FD|nr:DUF2190 family protein [Azospirillum agricola]MBP2232557.1 putative RecA/RadA family phage recombinase [Azospirillum agricola]